MSTLVPVLLDETFISIFLARSVSGPAVTTRRQKNWVSVVIVSDLFPPRTRWFSC